MLIKHALVVDDSKSARFSLRKLLQQAGLSVDMVDSGEAALEYLRENRPDVVFMDHMMPGLNGLEAAKAIKENPTTTMIPIVMSTSKEGDDYMQEVMANGATSILPKPSSPDMLAQVLENLNELSQALIPPAQPVAAPNMRDEVVESRVRDSVTVAVKTEVEQQLADGLTAQLNQLKQDLLTDFQSISSDASKLSVETATHELRQELIDTIQKQMDGKITTIVQQIADDIYANRAQELENRFTKKLNEQLLTFKAEATATRSLDSKVREEISRLVQSVANKQAVEAAQQTARVVAEEVASQAAQKAARQTTESLTKVLLDKAMESNRPKLVPVYLISILAMAISILAAVGFYFIE